MSVFKDYEVKVFTYDWPGA